MTDANRAMLEAVVDEIGDLRNDVVFVGGAVTFSTLQKLIYDQLLKRFRTCRIPPQQGPPKLYSQAPTQAVTRFPCCAL